MVFLVLLCLALAVLLGGGYYAYRVAFWSPQAGREDLPVHKGSMSPTFLKLPGCCKPSSTGPVSSCPSRPTTA